MVKGSQTGTWAVTCMVKGSQTERHRNWLAGMVKGSQTERSQTERLVW